MIRFICRERDASAAINVGGPVDVEFRTFTDAATLEAFLRFEGVQHSAYMTRECVGVELVEALTPTPTAKESK